MIDAAMHKFGQLAQCPANPALRSGSWRRAALQKPHGGINSLRELEGAFEAAFQSTPQRLRASLIPTGIGESAAAPQGKKH
jgi:hypothetical protein